MVCLGAGEITALRGRNLHLHLDDDQFSFSDSSTADQANLPAPTDQHQELKEKIRSIPHHISESQKLLKTSIFQVAAPQYPTKCLILNIYKIKQPQCEDRDFCSALETNNNLHQTARQAEICRKSNKVEITPSTIENNGQREQRGQREQKGQMEQRGLSGTGSVLSGERGDSTLYTQLTHQQKIQKFISQKENRNKNSLTPRSRSKFEHLIKNLRECNEDEQLVLYKVLESPPLSNNLKISEAVPYKGEPKVNFLWRVCRALDIYRLFKKKMRAC